MLRLLLLLPFLATSAFAQRVTISDTIQGPTGAISGTLEIKAPTMVAGDGTTVVPDLDDTTVTITAGVISVMLYPNTDATPSGTSYSVEYVLDTGQVFTETWVVPTGGPHTVGDVRVTSTPTPGVTFLSSQISDFDLGGPTDGDCVRWDDATSKWIDQACPGAGGGDSISVNGSAVVDADFDDATPTAGANETNILWSTSGSGPADISGQIPWGSLGTVNPSWLSYQDISEISVPANPAANIARFYSKDDGGTTKVCMRDSAGTETCIGDGGGGTVTSVGLSLPAIFSVSGSPVTTSGTLTGSLVTQTANTLWAGPVSGAPANPTFRAMVADDIPVDIVGLSQIDDDANSPTAGDFLTVEVGAASIDYLTPNAGTDVTADLEEESHASEHTAGGGDVVTVDGVDAGAATTRSNENPIQIARHDTDCTSLTDGVAGELCYEEDANTLYQCEPTAGGCDTGAEWILVVATPDTHTHDGADIDSGTVPAARVGTDHIDAASEVAADVIGTEEVDDGADSPGSGEYVRVDTVDQAGFEYRSTAEVLSDIGAAASAHTHDGADIDSGTVPAARVGTDHIDAASEVAADVIGLSELDDDANTPVAGDLVVVETGAASVDYVTPNAGTDVTTDLEEEAHASEHTAGGGDVVTVDGLDAGAATTRSNENPIQIARHDTDCTSLTDGAAGELCYEEDANTLYQCEPTAGGCDTPGEWILVVATPDTHTHDGADIDSGTVPAARVGANHIDAASEVAADVIGTEEVDDGADTPGSGEYVRVDTVDQAGFEYRSTAEVLSDIGAAASVHTHDGADIDSGTVPAARVGADHIDAASEVAADVIGLSELDDDANTPVAGDFVTVETGAASVDYVTPNAGTDVTADLEEESHASEHQNGGGDEIATATSSANAIPKAEADGDLSPAWIGQDVGYTWTGFHDFSGGENRLPESTVGGLPTCNAGNDGKVFVVTDLTDKSDCGTGSGALTNACRCKNGTGYEALGDGQAAPASGDSITVNGSTAEDADFDDTDPAPPTDAVNVDWQLNTATSPDSISANVPTDGQGLAQSGGDLVLELNGSSLSKGASGLQVAIDGVTPTELDDDANSPTAGDFVIVEAGAASFDYLTPNAGTDITADLEEESHASEHTAGGGDVVTVDGVDAGAATTRSNENPIQIARHDTDCTSLTDGVAGELCYEEDANTLYQCEPTAGGCDSAAEWILVVATPASHTHDGADIDSGTVPAARVGADHIDDAGEVAADVIGLSELDDDANSPTAGDIVIVEVGAASVDYLTPNAGTDVTADLEEEAHASEHTAGGTDIVTVDGVDAGAATTRSNENKIQIASHDTDCTALTDGVRGELCIEEDSENLYSCQPTAGGCDTPGEWVLTGDGSGGAPPTDSVGTDELDDDANSPTAGDFVIVEAGAASFDYQTPNAGTDVTADLEEESHASEHQHSGGDEVATATPGANAIPKAGAGSTLADGWIAESNVTQHQGAGTDITGDLEEEAHASEHTAGGADIVTVDGLDAGAATTRTNENPIQIARHNTDCTSLTDGVAGELCYEEDANTLYQCEPTTGGCDTGAEWILVNATPVAHTHDGADIDSGTVPAARVGADHIDDAGEVAADVIGLSELDDDANTPVAGDFVVVETGAASVDYVTPNAGTDVTADLEEEAHASEHTAGGADIVTVDGLDAGAATTRSNENKIQIASHDTDCTSLTDGVRGELCIEEDSENLYSCQPTAGGCDTPGEWILTGDGSGGAPPVDSVGTPELDDAADSPAANQLVVVSDSDTNQVEYKPLQAEGGNEITVTLNADDITLDVNEANLDLANLGGTLGTGQAAAGFRLESEENAGTDVTADLEEETHASEHTAGGGDIVTVDGVDAGAATTRSNENKIKIARHNTDCTSLTDGEAGELCYEEDDNTLYQCEPTAGGCDTAAEWILVVANPAAGSVDSVALATANKTEQFCYTIRDLGADIPNTADVPSIWMNRARAITLTEISCESDDGTGSPTIQLQRDDGSVADICSADLTCGTTVATCTPVAAEDNVAIGDEIDHLTETVSAGLRRINVCVTYTVD